MNYTYMSNQYALNHKGKITIVDSYVLLTNLVSRALEMINTFRHIYCFLSVNHYVKARISRLFEATSIKEFAFFQQSNPVLNDSSKTWQKDDETNYYSHQNSKRIAKKIHKFSL